MKKYEELEHTADLRLRIYGDSLSELLRNAAEGMFSLIGQADFTQADLRELKIQIPGPSGAKATLAANEELLHRWLKRLLQEFNLYSFFPVKFVVEVASTGCAATVTGGTFDPAIHTFYTEVKGVTLHGLKVVTINSQWQAEVIFDV